MSELRAPSSPTPETVQVTTPGAAQVGRGIAVAAGLIAVGNLLSSMLGGVRESIISSLFAVSAASGAFALAARVPNTLYDLLVGGVLSAALVPVFSELAERDERELGYVAGTIFTIATLLLCLLAAVTWIAAPYFGVLFAATIRETTVTLIRWMLPATIFMGLAGLLTGLLQARRQFLLPAFSTATFNIGIILGGLALSGILGVKSLAIGMSLGALGQVLLQAPGVRGVRLRPNLNLRHPAVRRIGKLYLPVLIGLSFSLIGTAIDSILVSPLNGGAGAAQQRFATTLIQLALGIVASAISLAALPTLARQGGDAANLTEFRRTLALSIKALLLLILPITALMAALAFPIASFLFQWRNAKAADAAAIASALLVYLPSLIAAGIDQPLIFAFYARRNTLLPNLVQGVAIAAYLVVAFGTVRVLGVYGLILGNVAQWWVHALLMLWFAHRRLDALRHQRLLEAAWKGLIASGVAGGLSFGLYLLFNGIVAGKWGTLGLVVGLGSVGAVAYLALAFWLRLEALQIFGAALRRRIRR